MSLFTTAALIFALLGLFSLNKTAREIASKDLVFIHSINKLRESIVAQERYAGKYSILKEAEFVTCSRDAKRSLREFSTDLTHPGTSWTDRLCKTCMLISCRSNSTVCRETANIEPLHNASTMIVPPRQALHP